MQRLAFRLLRSAAAFSFVLASAQAAEAQTARPDVNYSLGQGWEIPGTGLRLGGYATASYIDGPDEPERVAVDNLSLFLWWEGEGRWKFFSEFEYENLLSSRSDRPREDGYLSWERAYVDYALTDTASIRAGKFLTPIGRWNLIHATPLVWTTSRPLVTTEAFPTNMTGLMISGTLPGIGSGIDYSLYGSTGNEIRPNPDLDPFSSAVGGHLSIPLGGDVQLGFSYADFEQERARNEHRHLAGVDFLWTRNRFELSGEAVYRFSSSGGASEERGAFVQLAAPLTQKLYAVGRIEAFRSAGDSAATRVRVVGLNYRITPALVLKGEWVDVRHDTVDAPEGFMTSISVLL